MHWKQPLTVMPSVHRLSTQPGGNTSHARVFWIPSHFRTFKLETLGISSPLNFQPSPFCEILGLGENVRKQGQRLGSPAHSTLYLPRELVAAFLAIELPHTFVPADVNAQLLYG